MLTNDGHFVDKWRALCCQRSCCAGVEHSCTLVLTIKKISFNHQTRVQHVTVLPSKSRPEPLSHILSVGMLPYIQSPLKIRPKSLALSYCANAPYHHPCRSNRSQPPFRTAEDRIILLVVPKQSYWSGSLHLSLLSRPNAGSLSSTFLKESPFD